MTTTSKIRKAAAVGTVATTMAGLALLVPAGIASAGEKADIGYSFTFVNGQTISGTVSSNTVFIADAGGHDADDPSGMTLHVSCSDGYTGGWGEKDGPDRVTDSAWQIATWSIEKGSKTCASEELTATGSSDADTKDLDKAERKAQKEAEKAERKAQKEAEKAAKKAEKAAAKAQKRLDKANKAAKSDKNISYTLVFENGTVITGTSASNIVTLPNAGGHSVDNPPGMDVHVSCSDSFPGGWGEKDGPSPTDDSAWQIATWSIQKGSKDCTSDGFVPVSDTPLPSGTVSGDDVANPGDPGPAL